MIATLLCLGFQAAKPVKLSVPDIAGVKVQIPSAKSKATVLIFVGIDCPIANRMAPEIGRIEKSYRPRGIVCYLVYPDGTLKPKAVREHLASYSLECDAIVDVGHKLVKAVKASVTPQAVVLNPGGAVVYSGRINDLYEEHGKIKAAPSRNDLRVALDELLAGKEISQPRTPTIGCFIPVGP